MTSPSETPLALLGPARLIPLLTIDHADDAVPLARALVGKEVGDAVDVAQSEVEVTAIE